MALLLHIGLHKTGTSWLQDVVLPDAGNRLRGVGQRFEPRRDIVWPHPYHFDAAALRAKYAPLLAAVEAEGGIPVISDERLSGNPTRAAMTRRSWSTGWPTCSRGRGC